MNAKDVVLSTIVGSRAWDMQRSDSDIDRFVIHKAPITTILLGENYTKPHIVETQEEDITYYEIKVVCEQIIKGNPNFIIGVLSPKIIYDTVVAQRLRYITKKNLSKNIYPGINGMVRQIKIEIERKKLEPNDPICIKKCGQALRFLDLGVRILKGQELIWEKVDEKHCTLENVDGGLRILEEANTTSKLPNETESAEFVTLLLHIRRNQCLASGFINNGQHSQEYY